MEILLVVSLAMTVVGAIQQKGQFDAQAEATRKQALLVDAEGDRQQALERAASAKEGFERAKDLQRVIGEIMSRGANSGFGVVGTVGSKIESSGAEFASEQGTREFNLDQRLVSLDISTASNVNSLNTEANILKSRGQSALVSGIGEAAGTLASFGARSAARGSTGETWANGDSFRT